MAYSYRRADRDQLFLMPTSMRKWLPEGHLGWFVLDVVAKVNTSAFHALCLRVFQPSTYRGVSGGFG